MQKIRKNDRVKVISGKAAASGREVIGVVRKILPREGRIIIEGYNMVKRHSRQNLKNPKGGIIEKEAPIHISNVMLISPQSNQPTKVAFRKNESEKKVRYSCKLKYELD